ncbi:substrate-binding domain-containing protein [Amphibacillus sediminis]|uniref:substrate-binding domain-containing protein n=1 Tax=Amphibacillus sediminis TaxID=360185 RepID=UPI00082C8676|nr:substrate-binding domain-containing protein [Amphibacillus sediminis]
MINDTVPDPNSVEVLMKVQKQTKLVMINGRIEGMHNCSIRTDEARGMELIIEHLVNQGHEKIALIGGVEGITTTDIKVSTFKKELKKYNLAFKDSWQIYSEYDIAGGEAGFEQLIRTNRELPTALIGMNDLVGIGMIKASKRFSDKGFAFVGFDDTTLAQTSSPELTSVRHPYEELGKLAIDMMDAEVSDRDIVITPRLVAKESTLSNRNI